MKDWIGICFLAPFLVGVVACGSDQQAEPAPPLAGPALVMFYTDN